MEGWSLSSPMVSRTVPVRTKVDEGALVFEMIGLEHGAPTYVSSTSADVIISRYIAALASTFQDVSPTSMDI
jgi:hypothetical protein